jgi:hypothetical protein
MNPPFHKQFSTAGIRLLGSAFLVPALLASPCLAQAAKAAPAPKGTATTATTADRIIQVGGNSQIRTIAEAAAMAQDGDTVVIAPGEYYGDVATWRQDRLTIRAGAGGRVKLIAAGSHAGGKGIWVISGGRVTVEDIDFVGARVPDRNGAGIRFEKGHLLVKRCSFKDGENGILTAADPNATLEIENSEFGNNGDGSGSTHNLYVGDIGMLKLFPSCAARPPAEEPGPGKPDLLQPPDRRSGRPGKLRA